MRRVRKPHFPRVKLGGISAPTMADGHRICSVDEGTVQAGSHTMPPYGAYRAVAYCLCLCLSLSLYGSGMAITLIPLGP